MEIADTITGYLMLGGLFAIFTVMNYRILYMRIKKAEKIPSPAPFIGGAAGAFLIICIFGFENPWLIIIPLLVDPGSIPLLVWLIICIISDIKRK